SHYYSYIIRLPPTSTLFPYTTLFRSVLAQIQPAAFIGLRFAQRHGEIRQAGNVLAHQTVDGRVHMRVREALDLINVVRGRQLARAGLRKIVQRPLPRDRLTR